MKIQCVLCKEIVPIGAFEPASDGIRISCSACRRDFFLPASGEVGAARAVSTSEAADPTPGDGDEPDDAGDAGDGSVDCPKCFTAITGDRPACPGCGLSRERFESYAADADDAAPEALEALWQACEADWSRGAAHEAFIEAAATGDHFAYAARRYRQRGRREPGDPVVRRQLERIARMTEATMLAKKVAVVAEEGMTHYKGLVIFLVLLVVVGGAAGYWALTKLGPG